MSIKNLKNPTIVNRSYWENQEFFKEYDLVVIGSGIVGLFSAYFYKLTHKKAKVLVLERGVLPEGASYKNAGFACFGSVSEISADLKKMNNEVVWDTLQMRWQGLLLLRATLGDKAIDYRNYGGYELFKNKSDFEKNNELVLSMNNQIQRITGLKKCYTDQSHKIKDFNFKNISGLISNRHEGQLDTGKMMTELLRLVQKLGVKVITGVEVKEINDLKSKVIIHTNVGEIRSLKVIIATNGYAKQLLNIKEVCPARAQVLITKPIPDLNIKGSFHYHEGFYYFRNIHKRILLGGGRNLDVNGETTTEFGTTTLIQNQLNKLLKDVILPGIKFEIDYSWSGIMGVGKEKKPIIKQVSSNVIAAVRMGGMGIAIGSLVGKKAAELCD